MDIAKIQQEQLNKKYGNIYRRIRGKIMDVCQLHFSGNWEIHCVNPSSMFIKGNKSLIYDLIVPEDKQKGYYMQSTNTISISDWSLSHPEDWELYRVIIHELLHANGYSHGQEMLAREEQCLNLLKEKYKCPLII